MSWYNSSKDLDTVFVLRCDNEPAISQLQRLATKTRQSMGLKIRMDNSVAYDHGNSLAEDGIARVRQLAASLMHQLHGGLGLQLSTGSAIWTWALRHAAWLISRFSVLRGATPYELAFGRQYNGDLCEYGEPVYGYVDPGTNKAAARWRRALFLGKAALILKTALCFSMDSPLFFPTAFEGSVRPGGAILPTTFTASVTHGNSNQVLVPGFCLP